MSRFTLFPAIDLKGGRCVRLLQGRADQETVYSNDPVAMALDFQAQGAEYLHIVDLDGAFEGRPMHLDLLDRMTAAIKIPVELGGGMRTDDDIRAALDAGVDRVILGTRAIEGADAIRRLAETFAEKLVVGIDARDGRVQTRGWVETTDTLATELACSMAGQGVRTIIYTDTSRDGMLQGVNLAAMAAMCDACPCDIVASGGVTNADDIRNLVALKRPNLAGVIIGKALYEGRVNLPQLLKETSA
jgi:phosphoribosylformimino-5-aminoimidazole carboxamide ribotide isomerase